MREITEKQVKTRLTFDNPWWGEQAGIAAEIRKWPKRAYFETFSKLVTETDIRRAVVLMGPRRVGKTVMIQQTVQHLIDRGTEPKSVLYVSLDTPTYMGLPLERLFRLFTEHFGHSRESRLYVFFDEIQYLKDWEVHLKSLVDSFPAVRFVASGSAAAALRLRGRESGAGRFTDFPLPPLSFAEFLSFSEREQDLFPDGGVLEVEEWSPELIGALNDAFVDYLNYGGFPESVFSRSIREDFHRFVGSDIIDKVLLRDLPSLYGISDTQELNRLFATLAYNTGNEISLDQLSKSSGVAKNTLKRFLEYLEAAFLIRRVYRVDRNAKRFKRAVRFKVYLTNPCLRAALFGPVASEDQEMGTLAETAYVSQLVHTGMIRSYHYARWKSGEVDIVGLDPLSLKPMSATEIKWSDRAWENPSGELRALVTFCKTTGLDDALVLTRSSVGTKSVGGIRMIFGPLSALCLIVVHVHVQASLDQGVNPLIVEKILAHVESIRDSKNSGAV